MPIPIHISPLMISIHVKGARTIAHLSPLNTQNDFNLELRPPYETSEFAVAPFPERR